MAWAFFIQCTLFVHRSSSIVALEAISCHLKYTLWYEKTFDVQYSPLKSLISKATGNGFSGTTMTAENCATNYLDASGAAFTHSVGHSGARRINHGDETQKTELLCGEVCVVAVEGESLRKLGWRQIQVAESCRRRGIKELIAHHGLNLLQLFKKKKSLPVKEKIFMATFTLIFSRNATKITNINIGFMINKKDIYLKNQSHISKIKLEVKKTEKSFFGTFTIAPVIV